MKHGKDSTSVDGYGPIAETLSKALKWYFYPVFRPSIYI